MIGFLSGQVLDASKGQLLLKVAGSESGNSAVGYQLQIPSQPEYLKLKSNDPIELFVHTHVREEALDLYGFFTRKEKQLFLCLLGVSGIGPKGALQIISSVSFQHFVQAILEQDQTALQKMPGVGKKTAERLLLELKDKLQKQLAAYLGSDAEQALNLNRLPSGETLLENQHVFEEARSALIQLGYRDNLVRPLIQSLWRVEEGGAVYKTTEELVRAALRQLL